MLDFKALTDDDRREFYRLYRLYWKEARKCEPAQAYLAGCVMLGAALETLLILMVDCYREEVAVAGHAPMKDGGLKPLLNWNLGDLLRVAKALNWLPAGLALNDDWNHRKARIGDYAEVARMVRNLAHPARYRTDHFQRRVTKRHLRMQFEVVEGCRGWLVDHNYKALRQGMAKDESTDRDDKGN